jgi:polyphosphate glucokinase
MLFLGLGTGLGSALMVRGHIVPMELGQLSYRRGKIEDYVGVRGLQRLGKKKWRKILNLLVARFVSALELDDDVLGGGNAKQLDTLPKGCRVGDNANAFLGGFRLWARPGRRTTDSE